MLALIGHLIHQSRNRRWLRDRRPIAAVDFDGVLHPYRRYNKARADGGAPLMGVVEALERLREHGYRIVVFSARTPRHIWPWLREHNLERLVDGVTAVKPPAEVYFDDRAVHVPANTHHALWLAVNSWLQDGAKREAELSQHFSDREAH